MSSRSWRNLQQELARSNGLPPTVASLNGWRRFSRPIGLAAVAALAGAGLAVFLSQNNDQPTAAKSTIAANTLPPTADQRTMQVAVTRNGCSTNAAAYPSGKLLVTINNTNATGLGSVSLLQDGMRIAEREGVVAGSSASISVNLQPGKYVLSCPGTAGQQTPVTVTGPKVSAGPDMDRLLSNGGKIYGAYVSTQAARIVRYLNLMSSLASNGRIVLAQCAYAHAREALDRISQATGIEDLGGESLEDGWTKIGELLFYRHTAAGVPAATVRLLKLATGIQQGAAKLPFDSVNVSRSAEEQIGGIFQTVITGAAEPWSHGDLMDIFSMVQGSRAATNALRPALITIDPNFVATIDAAYNSFNRLALKYHNGDETTGGFVAYNRLSDNTKKSISHALQAIQIPVSRVPAKLVRQQ